MNRENRGSNDTALGTVYLMYMWVYEIFLLIILSGNLETVFVRITYLVSSKKSGSFIFFSSFLFFIGMFIILQ